MENEEKIIFVNTFGAITDKRVILDYKTTSEEIPLEHISSVSIMHRCNRSSANLGLAIALSAFVFLLLKIDHLSQPVIVSLLLVLLGGLVSGLSNSIGYPYIIMSAKGIMKKPMIVPLGKNQQAMHFVSQVMKISSESSKFKVGNG